MTRALPSAHLARGLAAGFGSPLTLALTLALAATLTAAPAAALDDWRRYESKTGRFGVDMPGEPEIITKERWFPMASFVSYVYKTFVGDDAFGVNHTDLPRVALMFAGRGKIFDSTRDGFLEDSDATEVSFAEIEVQGRPGRELVYDIPAQGDKPALRGKARMFFDEKRLYVFYTEVTVARSQRDIDRFFGSFQLDSE